MTRHNHAAGSRRSGSRRISDGIASRKYRAAGLRAEEAVALDIADLHFDRGPFGKIHVRFGKAAKGSGPRPRWVPMLDQLDLILRWYLQDVRPSCRPGLSPSPIRAAGGCTAAASATGWLTCWSWKAPTGPTGSARTRCAGPARPTVC